MGEQQQYKPRSWADTTRGSKETDGCKDMHGV